MKKHTIEASAATVDEARAAALAKVPDGFDIITEQILSDGNPQIAYGFGETVEGAAADAVTKVPAGAPVLQQRTTAVPGRRVQQVAAADEAGANLAASLTRGAIIASIRLVRPASKGFLGIGKRLPKYSVEITQRAVVEIDYRRQPTVSITYGKQIHFPIYFVIPAKMFPKADTGTVVALGGSQALMIRDDIDSLWKADFEKTRNALVNYIVDGFRGNRHWDEFKPVIETIRDDQLQSGIMAIWKHLAEPVVHAIVKKKQLPEDRYQWRWQLIENPKIKFPIAAIWVPPEKDH